MTMWIGKALALIPPHLRQDEGRFGVRLFLRTRTRIIVGPHQDDEEYVSFMESTGLPAELHRVGDLDDIACRVTPRTRRLLDLPRRGIPA
jgi:hypothetical protein